MADFFDNIQDYFKSHPKTMALVPITLGLMMIVGAILNWNWLYAPNGTLRGIGGLGAIFGRTVARIAGVIIGIVFFFGSLYHVSRR